MTTAELIAQLQKLDPEGDTTVCIGNENIWFCEKLPAYYDGRLQVLSWGEGGHPVSGTRTGSGYKIKIRSLDIQDCFEYPGFKITYEGDQDRDSYEKGDRQAAKEFECAS